MTTPLASPTVPALSPGHASTRSPLGRGAPQERPAACFAAIVERLVTALGEAIDGAPNQAGTGTGIGVAADPDATTWSEAGAGPPAQLDAASVSAAASTAGAAQACVILAPAVLEVGRAPSPTGEATTANTQPMSAPLASAPTAAPDPRSFGRMPRPAAALEGRTTQQKVAVDAPAAPAVERVAVTAPTAQDQAQATAPGLPRPETSREAPVQADPARVSPLVPGRDGDAAQQKVAKPAPGIAPAVGPAASTEAADSPTPPPVSFAVASAPTVTGAAAPTPGPPAGTAAQLAPAVLAVHRRGPDGTHRLSIEVTPEALGRIRVEVELRDGQVALTIAGGSDAARDALRAALPELRRVLEAAGVSTGALAVSPDDAGTGQPGTQPGAGQSDWGRPGQERPTWNSGRHDPRADPPAPERLAVPAGRPGALSLDLQL